MKVEALKNKKIAILWFWKEGQSTLKFLTEQGIDDITILDSKIICLEDAKVPHIVWDTYLDTLWDFDIIIKTPGISPFHDKILPYRDRIISQAHIFFSEYTGRVIWITWTKGKSTISTLLYTCLSEAGYDVKLVWNIWNPVLDEVDIRTWKAHDFIVYELSSYMLQDFSPKLYMWILNNVYPCHLDWHFDSFTIYKEAKINILKNAEIKVINGELHDDSEIRSIKEGKVFFSEFWEYLYDERWFFIGQEYVYTWDVGLQWEHNKKNTSWVIAVLHSLLQDSVKVHNILMTVLPNFNWLPNRIENIWTYEWIVFINDAIATTPESTIAAIDTFSDSLQTLFLWWEDSGFSFEVLREKILHSHIQNIVAFPDTSIKIFPEIDVRDYEIPFEVEIEGKSIQVIKTRSMKSGVDFAYKTTFPGRIALLSCAAPSFSLWSSYIDKALEFKKEVREY